MPNNWGVRKQSGGVFYEFKTRKDARNFAHNRSRFDDCAYEVLKRSKTAEGLWDCVQVKDFHKHLRAAFT
jgi:hypothetical protein